MERSFSDGLHGPGRTGRESAGLGSSCEALHRIDIVISNGMHIMKLLILTSPFFLSQVSVTSI